MMQIRGKSILVAALALAVVSMVPLGVPRAAQCPGPVSGEVRSSLYEFTYESWVKPKPNAGPLKFQFGRCLENKRSKSLWFNWRGMNFSGYVPGHDSRPAVIGRDSDLYDKPETELWYGDRPTRLPQVQAIRPPEEGQIPGLGAAAHSSANLPRQKDQEAYTDSLNELLSTEGKVWVESFSEVFIPLDFRNPTERLANFFVRFFSEVSQLDFKLSLEIIPSKEEVDALGAFFKPMENDAVLFTVSLHDAFLMENFETNNIVYDKISFLEPNRSRFYIIRDWPEPSVRGYRISWLSFWDVAGRIIATMPIAILEPM